MSLDVNDLPMIAVAMVTLSLAVLTLAVSFVLHLWSHHKRGRR